MTEKRLADVNLESHFPPTGVDGFSPSPRAWEDQVFYFLMLDRFSDNKESGYRDINGNLVNTSGTALFKPVDRSNALVNADAASAWREAGNRFVGGNLKGLTSKIGYLKRLGVTTIWVSPIFKQVSFQQTYHGYGIQDFLQVDPHFGTREDLKELVQVAHENGIYVILDIILNHAGNVFSYDFSGDDARYDCKITDGNKSCDPRWDNQPYRVAGFNDAQGRPTVPFVKSDPNDPAALLQDTNASVWPIEFQDPDAFTQKGLIKNFDHDPEFREGDFFDLKDMQHGEGRPDDYRTSAALNYLCQVFKFWMTFADLDGFRIDTVKHMDVGATRFFASAIHEYAQSINKDNFFLVGEITGGRGNAFTILELTGLNAALGIDDIPQKLEFMVKGTSNPVDYFQLFRNSVLVNKDSNTWFRDKVVTMFDDHDQVRKGESKARFAAGGHTETVFNALALNALTLGIPCIYYGSEQGFDGEGQGAGADRFLREAMFGGAFGAFRTVNRHCFDEDNPIYKELAQVLAIRQQSKVLRRGRQFLREISGDGEHFGVPQMIGDQLRGVVPWSRILAFKEVLIAINTDYTQTSKAHVTIDANLHKPEDKLICVYSKNAGQVNQKVEVKFIAGRATVLIEVPPAGLVIFQ
jgi:glycosidase